MVRDWISPIYGFFQPRPAIETVAGRRCHEFKCAAPHCKGKGVNPRIVRRYLDKADRGSTSNLHKHTKNCWGEEIVSKALVTKNNLSINEVRISLSKANVQDGTITALFERNGKENVTFSTRQHTYMEARLGSLTSLPKKKLTYLHAELNSFDGWQRAWEAWQLLMIQASTVLWRLAVLITRSHLVELSHAMFMSSSEGLKNELLRCYRLVFDLYNYSIMFLHYFWKEYNGRLSFATDAWTSPNQRAYVTVSDVMAQLGLDTPA